MGRHHDSFFDTHEEEERGKYGTVDLMRDEPQVTGFSPEIEVS